MGHRLRQSGNFIFSTTTSSLCTSQSRAILLSVDHDSTIPYNNNNIDDLFFWDGKIITVPVHLLVPSIIYYTRILNNELISAKNKLVTCNRNPSGLKQKPTKRSLHYSYYVRKTMSKIVYSINYNDT